MKTLLALVLMSGLALAADTPPQTVIPRPENATELDRMWGGYGSGCDLLNYYLFNYTDQHPERVRYLGDDDVVAVDGFVEYLESKSPIIVKDYDGNEACLIFFHGSVLTPWGQEIVFLLDRKKDGYLSAFGERRSVNEYADPWKKHGFKYSKAVGITLKSRPTFMQPQESLIRPLNDNDYNRLKKTVIIDK